MSNATTDAQDARIVRRVGYVAISNAVTADTRLTIEARGLLVFLMSCSADWVFRPSHLMKICGVGRDKYYRMINELKTVGYLHIHRVHDDQGRFLSSDWEVLDEPCPENPDVDEPCPEKPDTVKPTSGKSAHLRIPIDKKPKKEERDLFGEPEKKEEKQKPKTIREILMQVVSDEVADAFIKHRRTLKKPLTEFAAERIIKQLKDLNEVQADDVMGRSIENGWAGVFPKPEDKHTQVSSSKGQYMDPTVARVMRQKAEERAMMEKGRGQ